MTIEFNPFTQAFTESPYDMLAQLRTEAPCYYYDLIDAMVLTKYEDVKFALSNSDLYGRLMEDYEHYKEDENADELPNLTWMIKNNRYYAVDKAGQMKFRRLIGGGFKPRAIENYEHIIQDVLDERLDLIFNENKFDLGERFSLDIPMRVMGKIMGIAESEEEQSKFRESAQAFFGGINPTNPLEVKKQADKGLGYVFEVLRGAIKRKDELSDKSMLKDIIHIVDEHDDMDEREILIFFSLLLTAGSDTIARIMNMSIITLLDNPELITALRQDRSLLPDILNECFRLNSVIKFLPRFAKKEMDVNGVTITKGKMVLLSLQSANLDETVFKNPLELIPNRPEANKTLDFGLGEHFCPGIHLGKKMAEMMMNTFLDHCTDETRVLKDTIVWDMERPFVRLITHMQVENLIARG